MNNRNNEPISSSAHTHTSHTSSWYASVEQVSWTFRGFLILFVLCIATSNLRAQPIISYLLPDIGAPGMMIQVEIIAPNTADTDGNSFSNTDSIFTNNANESFRLECVRPADRAKVTFSPVVTSWNGRMLSTVAFVSPNCLPNSTNWNQLADAWRIPVQLVTPNFSSNVDTFYIVNTTHFGDLSAISGTVFGTGQLGVRSRRGAMIVDSIILKNTTYTFSVSDPDNNLNNGNQAYLPAVLIAQGRIVGSGPLSRISVDAVGVDGGPGGGGGAGYFCDNIFANTKDGGPGGAGYCGGGRGGRNGTGGFATKAFQAYGLGSGPKDPNGSGNSLNKTAGAFVDGYEAAGGASGHPFGRSGACCNDGNNCISSGGYGGASGSTNTKAGAGAGHKTKGVPTNSGGDNNGAIYGNTMNVPLSGGSGGAGGNPQAIVTTCAGGGGGGGGALQLFALALSQVHCSALGANGSSGTPVGGSGSGGSINISSKLGSSAIVVSVSGGTSSPYPAAGSGRVRTDGSVSIDASKSDAVVDYNGPTIDTISSVKPPFTLSGRGRAGDSIAVYMKSDNSQWTKLSKVLVNASNTWTLPVNYVGADQNLYFLAAQEVRNPVHSSFTAQPSYVLSSAGAAMVNIVRIAEVSCDPIRNMGSATLCPPKDKLDTFYIRNLGNADVVLDTAAFLTGTLGFSIDSPKPMKSILIKSKDSIRVIVRFQNLSIEGTLSDRLLIRFPIGTTPQILTVDYTILAGQERVAYINVASNFETQGVYSIDFDRVCANVGAQQYHAIRNVSISKKTIDVTSIKVRGTSGVFNVTMDKRNLVLNDTAHFLVRVPRGAAGVYYDTLQLEWKTDSCFATVLIPLKVTLVETRVNGYDSKLEDFGYVKVGKSLTRRFTIRNTGSGLDSANFKKVPTVPKPWSMSMMFPDTVPRVLAPGDSIVFILTFSPDSAQSYQFNLDWIVEELGASCPATVSFHPRGIGTNASILPTVDTVRFGRVFRCTVKRDSFWLKNTGSSPGKVYAPAVLTGPDAARFRVVQEPKADSTVMNTVADSVLYVVEFTGDPTDLSASLKSAQIAIRVFDDSARTITVYLTAQQVQSNLDLIDKSLTFNNAPVNSQSSLPLGMKNATDTLLCILDVRSQHPEIKVVPNSIDISPGQSISLAVNVTPTSLGDINDTLTIYVNCPCIDSIKVPVFVHPTNNGLIFSPAPIRFDTVRACVVPADINISIRNIDNSSQGLMDTVYIEGQDAAVFPITLSWSSFPYIIPPQAGDNKAISVSYRGAGTKVGAKSAYLVVRYRINNQTIHDTIQLSAWRDVPLHLDSTTMEFGSVKQGQNKTMTMHVFNDHTQSLEIKFQSTTRGRQVFVPTRTVISPPGRQKDSMDIEFLADSTGDFRDTMYVKYFSASLGCTDSIPLYLHGNVLPGVNYSVWLEKSTIVDPTDTDVKINMYASLDSLVSFSNTLQFNAKVSIPADMFHAMRIESAVGRFIPDPNLVGNQQTLEISVDTIANRLSQQPTLIATIAGAAMLGAQECDSVYLVQFAWTNSGPHPTTISNTGLGNGEYCTTICAANGSRLLGTTQSPLQMLLSPNPGSDHLNVQVRSVEAGVYSFELFNETGQVVDQFDLNASPNRVYTVDRDLTRLSTGVYSLQLSTQTRSIRRPFVVIK